MTELATTEPAAIEQQQAAPITPTAGTTALMAWARRAGVPWMTSMLLSVAIGGSPSSAPARIAAVMSPGLPRRDCGTKDVLASFWAIW